MSEFRCERCKVDVDPALPVLTKCRSCGWDHFELPGGASGFWADPPRWVGAAVVMASGAFMVLLIAAVCVKWGGV